MGCKQSKHVWLVKNPHIILNIGNVGRWSASHLDRSNSGVRIPDTPCTAVVIGPDRFANYKEEKALSLPRIELRFMGLQPVIRNSRVIL